MCTLLRCVWLASTRYLYNLLLNAVESFSWRSLSYLMQRRQNTVILVWFLSVGCLESRHNASTPLKNLKLQKWFSKLTATHSWKLYLWAKGQFGMRFTLIWSCARVPQSHLLGFISNKQKGSTESASWNAAARKSVFKVLLRYMLTCRMAGWEQESLDILRQPSRTWLWEGAAY